MDSKFYGIVTNILKSMNLEMGDRFHTALFNTASSQISYIMSAEISSAYSKSSLMELDELIDRKNIKSVDYARFEEFLVEISSLGTGCIETIDLAINRLIEGSIKNLPYSEALFNQAEKYLINVKKHGRDSVLAIPDRLLWELSVYENKDILLLSRRMVNEEYGKRRVYFTGMKLKEIVNGFNKLSIYQKERDLSNTQQGVTDEV